MQGMPLGRWHKTHQTQNTTPMLLLQSTLAESLAQQQSQAIQTGTNRGMQAANALSSVLGVSQQFAGGAGQLAQQRAQLGKDYAQQQAQAGVNAMNQSTDVAKYLADISKNIYSTEGASYVRVGLQRLLLLHNNATRRTVWLHKCTLQVTSQI